MQILVIGDAILDIYIFGDVNRMSPEDPTIPVVDFDREDIRLGGCLNVAANLRSLSQNDISVLSVCSPYTQSLLKEKKIKALPFMYGPAICDEENEITKTRIINSQTGKQIVRLDNQLHFWYDDVERITEYLQNMSFGDIDSIVVSDYNKGIVNPRTIAALSRFLGPVFVDTKKPDLSIWDGISNCVIKINEKEWYKSSQQSRHKIIVTLGKRGAELRSTKDWHSTTQFSIKRFVEDPEVTGAGDVFIAALTIKFLEKKDLCEAINFANIMAAKSVRVQGTTEVKREI